MIPTRNISVKLLDGWSRRADTGCHHCGPIPTLLVKAVLAGVTRAVPKRGLPDILPSSHAAPELLGLVLTASSGAAKYRKLVPVPKASHSSESAGRVCATATAKTTTSVSTVRTRIFSCLSAPSRMTLVTTGASDLALESSSMQFSRSLLLPRRRFPPSDNDGG
ncbi:hypothetical protein GQR58_001994 [Nymphon striatum]|nr:hypothetical protein GQR58_001994 [Nymphon striatum]